MGCFFFDALCFSVQPFNPAPWTLTNPRVPAFLIQRALAKDSCHDAYLFTFNNLLSTSALKNSLLPFTSIRRGSDPFSMGWKIVPGVIPKRIATSRTLTYSSFRLTGLFPLPNPSFPIFPLVCLILEAPASLRGILRQWFSLFTLSLLPNAEIFHRSCNRTTASGPNFWPNLRPGASCVAEEPQKKANPKAGLKIF
jgi:hypothetical protein